MTGMSCEDVKWPSHSWPHLAILEAVFGSEFWPHRTEERRQSAARGVGT
jgi:hypothetical protein